MELLKKQFDYLSEAAPETNFNDEIFFKPHFPSEHKILQNTIYILIKQIYDSPALCRHAITAVVATVYITCALMNFCGKYQVQTHTYYDWKWTLAELLF